MGVGAARQKVEKNKTDKPVTESDKKELNTYSSATIAPSIAIEPKPLPCKELVSPKLQEFEELRKKIPFKNQKITVKQWILVQMYL